MSNYPPGVTGFEPAIAGAQSERDETRWVEHECGEPFEKDFTGNVEGTVVQWDFWHRDFCFECPQCKEDVDQADEPDEPEADEPDYDDDDFGPMGYDD